MVMHANYVCTVLNMYYILNDSLCIIQFLNINIFCSLWILCRAPHLIAFIFHKCNFIIIIVFYFFIWFFFVDTDKFFIDYINCPQMRFPMTVQKIPYGPNVSSIWTEPRNLRNTLPRMTTARNLSKMERHPTKKTGLQLSSFRNIF